MSGHHVSEFAPKSGIAAWIDRRLPIISMSNEFSAFPTPKNLNVWYAFGGILAVMLIVQIATGVVLSMHYQASVDDAFAAIEHIRRDVSGGWLLRSVHANGASMFFIAVYIHIFRGLYYGSHKEPREILWILGMVIFLLMMATAFLGYVLVWGQMSFWGAKVITSLFSAIPLAGDAIVTWLWGGFSVDNPTLNRFYSLHYLLPFVLAGVIILHIWALHVPGNNNPTGIDVQDTKTETLPFHPYYTIKDAYILGLFFIFYAFWVFYMPDYLGHTVNYVEANPLVTPAHIVPEWYFLPFYAILRAVPDKLMGVLAMFGSIAVLFIVPWLDTSKVRSATFRPIYKQFFWLLVLDSIVLGYAGSQPAEGMWLMIARVATAYYFLHFLVIMPWVGWTETPKPLPNSIAQSVLDKKGGASAQPAE